MSTKTAPQHDRYETNDAGSRQLYLDLLKRCVMNTIYEDSPAPAYVIGEQLVQYTQYSADKRLAGQDWPSSAHTMIGLKRLNNIQALAEDVLSSGVEGDFIEAGVWRGGATIFMRGILKAYGIQNRCVWVADSFRGFPKPEQTTERSYSSPGFKLIRERLANNDPSLGSSLKMLGQGTQLEEVKQNFARYGLLDEQVKFIQGFFSDTLPSAPVEKLAMLRADGDLYDSTFEILENLYPRVSSGGYVIIDDYNSFQECRRAVNDYLEMNGLQVDLVPIDSDAVFWQKR
jgi:O-methyltransferase